MMEDRYIPKTMHDKLGYLVEEAREVPRLLKELELFERGHAGMVRLLGEMITGKFELSSDNFRRTGDARGELGEQRRQALMMYNSVIRGQASRDQVRQRMREYGVLSE